MPISILRGPAGAGKSQWLRRNVGDGEIILDTTPIWAALTNVERDPEGRYRVRLLGEPGLRAAQFAKWSTLAFAARENLPAWFTIANSSPEAITRVQQVVERAGGRIGRIRTEDPGLNTALDRLVIPKASVPDGWEIVEDGDGRKYLLDECDNALARWYQKSPVAARIVARKYGLASRRSGRR